MARTSRKTKKTDPIRVGIIGMGRAGWVTHTAELDARPGKFQFVAGCDLKPSRRKLAKDKYGVPTYTDARDLIADPNVEMVDIACNSPEHFPYAKAAMKAGKLVFLEKPIGLSYHEAKLLRRAVKRYDGKLYVRHNRRFESAFQHIREILDTGVLGEIYEVKLRRHSYNRRDDWQMLLDCGGGQLLNWGPHIIDQGLLLMGAEVKHIWSNLKRIAAVGDAEDHLKIVMTGRNNRVVDVEISGGVAIPEPAFVLFGTRGTLVCDERTIHIRHLDPKRPPKPRKASADTPPFYEDTPPDPLKWIDKTFEVNPKVKVSMESIWDVLHAAVREGKEYPISLDEIVKVMKVISTVKEQNPRFNRGPKPKPEPKHR